VKSLKAGKDLSCVVVNCKVRKSAIMLVICSYDL
jgi:hypothetical protein